MFQALFLGAKHRSHDPALKSLEAIGRSPCINKEATWCRDGELVC